MWVDQIGMLPLPSQTHLGCPRFFHHGAGIDIGNALSARIACAQVVEQGAQTGQKNPMIVCPACIAGNPPMGRRCTGGRLGEVIARYTDHGLGKWHYAPWIRAACRIPCHPCHIAVMLAGEPVV